MTDFLKLFLSNSLEFRADFEATIYGIHSRSVYFPFIKQTGIKIDTGAHGILIPLRTLGWDPNEIEKFVNANMHDKSKLSVLHGVESTNSLSNTDLRNSSDSFIKAYKGLVITTVADELKVGSLRLTDTTVRVTPFSTGNILLGMDVLKDIDTHIGIDKVSGKTILLSGTYDENGDVYEEFLKALEKHLGYTRINQLPNSDL